MSNTVINRNPDILGGTPVFTGTRVPVRILMEHLEDGYSLDYFLDHFPTVSREQAVDAIKLALDALTANPGTAVAPGEQVARLPGLAPQGG